MGRPINKKYFGNRNEGGGGAEGIASVTHTAGSEYSQGLTATVAAPDMPGSTAEVTVAVSALGAITGFTVTKEGSGYSVAPVVTLVKPANKTPTGTGLDTELTIVVSNATGIFEGMAVSGTGIGVGAKVVSVVKATKTVTLSVANDGAVSGTITFTDAGAAGAGVAVLTTGSSKLEDAIVLTARLTTTARANSDIVKQVGSRRYVVRNQDGSGVCKLVAAAPAAAGEASLVATDSSGKTYYVTMLTSHKALVTQFGTSGHEFVSGTKVKWSLGVAVLNDRVTLASN